MVSLKLNKDMLSNIYSNKDKAQRHKCLSAKTEECRIKYRKDSKNMSPLRKQKSEEGKEVFSDFSGHGFIFGSTPRGTTIDNLGIRSENESDNNISSCSTLDIDNKVCLGSATLEDQVKELTNKLRQVEKERNEFKKRLTDALEEKEKSYRRLEVISSAHESRITEMHCVIAELSKKLRSKQESTILEENEHEGSDYSFHEGSAYNSENLTNPDAECQTEPLDVELPNPQVLTETVAKSKVEALQEEVLHLKAQIALLQSQIANNLDPTPEGTQNDNALLSFEEGSNESKESRNDEHKFSSGELNEPNNKKYISDTRVDTFIQPLSDNDLNKTEIYSSELQRCNTKRAKVETLIPKMAERVKLRRTVEEMHITGADILNFGIRNTEIVEHIVSDMINCDNAISNLSETTLLQKEIERLQRRIEHYKLRNTVLSLTLDECKENCEHLYLLCGKYESNAVALQLALNCSDRAIEAYDVMLALLESKLALLKEKSLSSQDSRRAVEAVARHLLERLDSENNLNENSLGPWQNTVCISNAQLADPWTMDDDCRLRNHVSKLKGRRAAVQNTVVTLESPYSPNFEKIMQMNKEMRPDNHNMDMEMAILMQELLSLREEVIETKQKQEFIEKEKKLAVEKVIELEEALSQLQCQLADSETVLSLASKDRSSYSEAEHSAIIERQLVEALTRESELKSRIQALISSVSECKKSSDEKYAQVQSNVSELQKANVNLSQSLEQCKKKYQTKIKRLEQKILQMSLNTNLKLKTQDVPETSL